MVTARKLAPTIVSPRTRMHNTRWAQVVDVALEAEQNWAAGVRRGSSRREPLHGHSIASPSWRYAHQVATIGDHTFLKVQSLKPKG